MTDDGARGPGPEPRWARWLPAFVTLEIGGAVLVLLGVTRAPSVLGVGVALLVAGGVLGVAGFVREVRRRR